MDRKYFDEGLKHICAHFTKPHPAKVISSIWEEVKDYPNYAINATSKRVEQEYHPGQLVAIGKIKDMIIIEGKKILGKEAVEREREAEEAKRQRGEHQRNNTNHLEELKMQGEYLPRIMSWCHDQHRHFMPFPHVFTLHARSCPTGVRPASRPTG